MRVNFTTYDMRRDQDIINPRTHPNVMVLSPETAVSSHPFWYARVLGIFHLDVIHTGSESRNGSVQRMEFLWVRWYGTEPGYRSGFKAARLPKIGFVPDTDEYAFGFLDPSLVLRGCHLVPAFAAGRTNSLLSLLPGQTTAARAADEEDDWENFYVIMCVHLNLYRCLCLLTSTEYSWVDRDMFMRYLGDAAGHIAHRESVWLGQDDADLNGPPDEGDVVEDITGYVPLPTMLDNPLPIQEDIPDDEGEAEDPDLEEKSDDEMDVDDDEEEQPGSEDESKEGDEEEEEGDSDSDDEPFGFDDEGFIDI